MEPSSSSQRKRHSSSSSSTTSSTSTSSNNEEDLGPPATKQPKIERNSDYPSFHSQQKSSTSTTDSEGESPSEGGPDVRGRDRRKRALCDEDEGPKKPVPSYSSFSMKMMASMGYKPGQGLDRDSSGIIAPIEKSLQKGRRGLGPPSTKQPKIERDSDYPSFHSQQKSSTSTTDSEGESPSEGGPSVQGRDRRKRALCDEDEGPKKPVPSYSSFSMKMMASMGYKPGQGLDRDSSGIIAPIKESLQKRRRGLGPPSTKQPKMERNSDYPSFHSQQKSSTSTTDSEGESPSEGGPDVRRRDRRKRALCDEDEGPKKPVPSYSSFSMKMMASMGYKPGQGLGRDSSGIIAPIEESLQKGRRGLGFNLDGLEKEDVKWEEEEVECEQVPVWLPPCELPVLTEEDMGEWMSFGERKLTIDDETLYCDEAVLDRILKGKSVFDSLGDKEFLEARQRSNPFETIKGAIFQNRAAMKMANIDKVFDFMFTEGFKLAPTEVLYFADICAGPGGFSEYVFWRKKWGAKGFGMTLKDPESGFDFKLDSFIAGPCETFDPHYGVDGYNGDGDITRLDNLQEFQSYVLKQSEDNGVHFVMADGGASVEGQENIQEILMKQLVLCQYLCALSILRTGGHFVCKVFDMFTPFSVGLFYLLYRSFDEVCIFKPVTSRPANSERYVVCKGLKEGVQSVNQYLFAINAALWDLKNEYKTEDDDSGHEEAERDVLEVVPYHLLQTEPFYTYITDSNNSIGINQIIALKKIKYFVKNTTLQETRQSELRSRCLKLWKVPSGPREAPRELSALEIFKECWNQLTTPSHPSRPTDVSLFVSDNFKDVKIDQLPFTQDPHSWKWFFACGRRFLLVGLGRNQIYSWDMKGSKVSLSQRPEFSSMELPRGTILEVEMVPEMTGEGTGQRQLNIVYIVDVLAIAQDVSYAKKPLKERLVFAEKLCKVLNKPCRKPYLTLKVKPYYRLMEMISIFGDLRLRNCKGMGGVPTLDVSHDETFVAPIGVIFCKVLQEPWQLHFSRSHKQLYFFNYKTNQKLFEPPRESVSPYLTVLATRHIWIWSRRLSGDICGIEEAHSESTADLTWSLLRSKLESFIKH